MSIHGFPRTVKKITLSGSDDTAELEEDNEGHRYIAIWSGGELFILSIEDVQRLKDMVDGKDE